MIRNIFILFLAFRLVKAQLDHSLKVKRSSGGGYEPQLEYVSATNVTSVHGRNATLQCPFDKSKNFATAWMRRQHGRTILIGRDSEKFIQSDHYSILHKEGVNDLTIFNVTEDDAGDYICQINTEPMKNFVFVVYVMRSPEIIQFDGKTEVKEGSNVQLSCRAIGNPFPTIKWRRSDGKRMSFVARNGEVKHRKTYEGEIITLVNVRQNDTGDVLCIAENGYPPLVSQKFELTIEYKPRISIFIDEFKHGGFMKIMCNINAVPLPKQLEMRIGGRLMNSRQEIISERVVQLHYERSMDFGQVVQCLAANSAGSDVKRETIPFIKYDTTIPRPQVTRMAELTTEMTINRNNFLPEKTLKMDKEDGRHFYQQMSNENREKSTLSSWSSGNSHQLNVIPQILLLSLILLA